MGAVCGSPQQPLWQRTAASLATKYQRGVVAIPTSVRPERSAENFAIFDFELSAEDLAAIATLDTKTSIFFNHCHPAIMKWMREVRFDL